MSATTVFLDPYQASKVLAGVIPANKVKRPNWLQTFFGNRATTEKDTINFDVEFGAKNTMGMFVSANADVTPIQLNDFGTKEFRFAYAKEGLNSPDYEEINVRQLGQAFGTVDVMANEAADLRAKLALAEQRFENLDELVARDILFYGAYTAQSEKHPKIYYNFGRTVITTETALNNDLVPEVNLATLIANGGAGKRAWGSTGGTKSISPVADLIQMYETAKFRAGTAACLMSADAYVEFNKDLTTNYKDAATTTVDVLMRAQLDILPRIKDVQGLTFKRSYPVGNGESIDIYIYDGFYHTRDGGVATKYVPDGYVLLIPPPDNGIKVYARIQHPRAQYAAMPRWINFWENTKTGKREWEVHTAFMMGHTDIDSVVCWKVK
jgi:hypothetical protein